MCQNYRQLPSLDRSRNGQHRGGALHRGRSGRRTLGRLGGLEQDQPRTWHALGIFVTLFLLAMLKGNHVGHVEDYVLIVFAVLVFGATVRDWWGRRRGWIR